MLTLMLAVTWYYQYAATFNYLVGSRKIAYNHFFLSWPFWFVLLVASMESVKLIYKQEMQLTPSYSKQRPAFKSHSFYQKSKKLLQLADESESSGLDSSESESEEED